MSNILITGASGLIGSRLTELLLQQGHEVVHLGRYKKVGNVRSFVWNVKEMKIDHNAFKGIDTIVHLAGAGIADKRWTEERKREILDSRTKSTQLLYQELKRANHQVKSFIAASAIGYYGFDDNETLFCETDKPGTDFLANVVKQWEASADPIAGLGIRVVKIRVGIVLSEKGGVLKEMARPVKLLAGAPLGSGRQNISWIHLDDLCAMFVKAIEEEKMNGVYNGTGPYPVTNRELTRAIAHTLKKPLILPPIPPFVLKILFGELGNLALYGSKVSSEKMQHTGFQYKFKDLQAALKDLLGR